MVLEFTGGTWEGEQELNTHNSANNTEQDDSDAGYFERLGAKTEDFFEVCFTSWGTWCANNPWLVLFLG